MHLGMQQCISRYLPRRNAVTIHASETRSIDMKKAICAMKAALGVRGIGCGMWRWQIYHNI